MIDRSKFYDITLVRLTNRGINPELAKKAAYIQAYVDGVRRRSKYEQEIIDQVWSQIVNCQ